MGAKLTKGDFPDLSVKVMDLDCEYGICSGLNVCGLRKLYCMCRQNTEASA